MATRMRNAGMAPFISPTGRGAWDTTVSGGARYRRIKSGTVNDAIGAAGQIAETSASDTYDVLYFVLVSDRLAAQTIDGTLQINASLDSMAGANAVLHVHAWVTQGDTGNLRGTLLTDHIEADAREVPETGGAWFWALDNPVTLSSVVCSEGDRVVIEVGIRFRNTTTSAMTVSGEFLGTSGVLTDAPEDTENTGGSAVVNWLEFSDDITELAQAIRATQVGAQVPTLPTPTIRATQVGAQVPTLPTPTVRLTQIGAQVARRIRPGGSFGTIIG